MKISLLTALISSFVAGTAFAAPKAPTTPVAAPAAVVSVADLFGSAIHEGFRLGLAGDGIRVAACPTGEAPVCSKEECRPSSVCSEWRQDANGQSRCVKWVVQQECRCLAWRCGGDH